ncbi:cytokine receptor common subunit beta-like [Engraulis encrasicolus]|uniref:cytokine receptor common subunit beta-like n=1 Tax=Engraulis encrasicolus TaxID=184585 RepID=UPI002FD250C3
MFIVISALWASVLPFLVLAYKSQPCQPQTSPSLPESPALASLQCRNDYSTHIQCSWAAAKTQHSQFQAPPLQLYHLAIFRNSPPPSHDATGDHHGAQHCRYNTSIFVIHAKDYFLFKVPHVKLLSKTIDLQHGERMGPPRDLSVKVTREGDWLLTWQRPPSSQPNETLTYQLHYRYTGQPWTELEVQGQEQRLEASDLEPGAEYSAKVRVKGTQQGVHTEWSSPVHWRHNGASVPGPSNLECVWAGEEKVRCSWELRRDLTQYVTYNLYYHIKPTALPQQCCPEPPRPLGSTDPDPVLSFSCEFSMDEPLKPFKPSSSPLIQNQPQPQPQLHLQLKAVPIKREFKSHKHIQPPRPASVRVEDRGQDWRLTWTLPSLGTVPIATEIYYWSPDAPEHNKTLSMEAGVTSHSIPTSGLRPAARYQAQVRALVDTSRSTHYSGYPSPWSQPVTWTTRSGLWSAFMISYVTMAVCVFVTVFLLYVCQRRFRQWEVSIPTPVNSKVMEDISKGHQKFQIEGKVTQSEADHPHIYKALILETAQTEDLLESLSDQEDGAGCSGVLAVEEDDSYHPVPSSQQDHAGAEEPNKPLNNDTSTQGSSSSASEASDIISHSSDLYISCPRSRSSTGGAVEVVVVEEDCPRSRSSTGGAVEVVVVEDDCPRSRSSTGGAVEVAEVEVDFEEPFKNDEDVVRASSSSVVVVDLEASFKDDDDDDNDDVEDGASSPLI